jgi:hypothetical protein
MSRLAHVPSRTFQRIERDDTSVTLSPESLQFAASDFGPPGKRDQSVYVQRPSNLFLNPDSARYVFAAKRCEALRPAAEVTVDHPTGDVGDRVRQGAPMGPS